MTCRRGLEVHSACHTATTTRGGMSSSSEKDETPATFKLSKLRISPIDSDSIYDSIYNNRMLNVYMYIGLDHCSLSIV